MLLVACYCSLLSYLLHIGSHLELGRKNREGRGKGETTEETKLRQQDNRCVLSIIFGGMADEDGAGAAKRRRASDEGELVRRIAELEAELRRAQGQHDTLPVSTRAFVDLSRVDAGLIFQVASFLGLSSVFRESSSAWH